MPEQQTPLTKAISHCVLSDWQHADNSNNIINGYYRAGKADKPIVHFLHGTGFSSQALLPVAALLPSDWSLLLSDVPGHGKSTQPPHRMPNWQAMAEQVAQAISTQKSSNNQKEVIGVGHSMGGILTLLAAAKYPNLFSKVILLDPVLFKTEVIIAQHLMRATGLWKKSALVRSVSNRKDQWPDVETMLSELQLKPLYRQWQPEVLKLFVQHASYKRPDGLRQLHCSPKWEGSIFGSYPKGLWKAVRKINIPVEILAANKSYSFIPKSVKKAATINPNIQWQRFGNHHCFPMEEPIETAEKITQLIRGYN